jgi:hypothetical protein
MVCEKEERSGVESRVFLPDNFDAAASKSKMN